MPEIQAAPTSSVIGRSEVLPDRVALREKSTSAVAELSREHADVRTRVAGTADSLLSQCNNLRDVISRMGALAAHFQSLSDRNHSEQFKWISLNIFNCSFIAGVVVPEFVRAPLVDVAKKMVQAEDNLRLQGLSRLTRLFSSDVAGEGQKSRQSREKIVEGIRALPLVLLAEQSKQLLQEHVDPLSCFASDIAKLDGAFAAPAERIAKLQSSLRGSLNSLHKKSVLVDFEKALFAKPETEGEPPGPGSLLTSITGITAVVSEVKELLAAGATCCLTSRVQAERLKYANAVLGSLEPPKAVPLDKPRSLILGYFSSRDSLENLEAAEAQTSRQTSSGSAELQKMRNYYTNSAKGELSLPQNLEAQREIFAAEVEALRNETAQLRRKILALDPEAREKACSELHRAGKALGRPMIPDGVDESFWQQSTMKVVVEENTPAEQVTVVSVPNSVLVSQLLSPYLKGHKRPEANQERARDILTIVSPETIHTAIAELSEVCPGVELRDAILASNPALFIDRHRNPDAFRTYLLCLEIVAPKLVAALESGAEVSVDQFSSIESIERWLEGEQRKEAFLAEKAEIESALADFGLEEPQLALSVLRNGCFHRGSYIRLSTQNFAKNAAADGYSAREILDIARSLDRCGLLSFESRQGPIELAATGGPEVRKILSWVRLNLPPSDPA